MFRCEVKHNHRPSWTQRLEELTRQRKQEEQEALTRAASDDATDHLRSSTVPRLKLPPINDKDSSKSESGYLSSSRSHKFERERNNFAHGHADKGVLFRSSLSTSLPDLPSLSKPQGTPRKYEKLSFTKRIHEGELAPAPGATIHPVAPVNPVCGAPRLPAIKTSTRKKVRRRRTDADVFKIYNSTRHTVEYYEHEGQVFVSDSHRPWQADCDCKRCEQSKTHWLDQRKRGAERKQRTSLHPGQPNASPVKEMREDAE